MSKGRPGPPPFPVNARRYSPLPAVEHHAPERSGDEVNRLRLPSLDGMTSGHTITIEPSSQHVEVQVAGERIASSDAALVLHETGLPDRYYLPRDDVRMDLLRPLNMSTSCPFKGEASYWGIDVGWRRADNLAWAYEDPLPDRADLKGRIAFYVDRLDAAYVLDDA